MLVTRPLNSLQTIGLQGTKHIKFVEFETNNLSRNGSDATTVRRITITFTVRLFTKLLHL
jgi:hypothetical protein